MHTNQTHDDFNHSKKTIMDKDLNTTIAKKLGDQIRRGSPVYKTILQAAQWQRDNYLLGQRYADNRARERPTPFRPCANNVRGDPNALGLTQIANLGASFIPSPTVQKALMPIVLQTPQGALYFPAKRGIVSLIDSQQSNVDVLVRNNILNLLEQERMRKLVMNSTKGYIADTSSKNDNK